MILDKDVKKLLATVDQAIALAEAREREELGIGEGNRDAFFYIADANGVITIHPDADFVVEQILMYDQSWEAISIEDRSAYRDLTDSNKQLVYNATTGIEKSLLIPSIALVPIGRFRPAVASPERFYTNADYWFDVPVEFLLPRGGTVRILAVNDLPPGGGVPTPPNPFVLVGFKVA